MFKKYTNLFGTSDKVGSSCKDENLKKLKEGYFVTYEKEEYEVISENVYSYSNEDIVIEWELLGFNKKFFLHYCEKNNGWFVNTEIPIRQLGSKFLTSLEKEEKIAKEILFNGLSYLLEESKTGKFHTKRNSTKETEHISSSFYTNNFNDSLMVIHTFKDELVGSNNSEYICFFATPVNSTKFSNISKF